MVGFALALGFDGVVSVLMAVSIVMMAVNRGAALQWEPLGVATLFLVLAAAMLACLLWTARSRGGWQKRPVRTQWVWGGLIFAAVGLAHLLIGAGIVALIGL